MGYKQMDNNFSFTDLSLADSMECNRAVSRMGKINAIINWSSIESLLIAHYKVGKSNEGADAYPPLLLLKCFLIQQWFRLESDPELETQINDRISFKKFLGLSFDQPSPDHSTFSRFRGRLSKDAMTKINHEVLFQLTSKGLTMPIRLTQNGALGCDPAPCQVALRLCWSFSISSLMRRSAPAFWSVFGSPIMVSECPSCGQIR
ncbi:MAG: transposase [Pseudomonadota bacterium]